jgi:hypothetical protein
MLREKPPISVLLGREQQLAIRRYAANFVIYIEQAFHQSTQAVQIKAFFQPFAIIGVMSAAPKKIRSRRRPI